MYVVKKVYLYSCGPFLLLLSIVKNFNWKEVGFPKLAFI